MIKLNKCMFCSVLVYPTLFNETSDKLDFSADPWLICSIFYCFIQNIFQS